MTDARAPQDSQRGPEGATIADWTDLGREMWSYLTGRHAVVNYTFDDMIVEVPRDIGPDSPRATWRVHGTLRVTTSDDASQGSVGGGAHAGAEHHAASAHGGASTGPRAQDDVAAADGSGAAGPHGA